MSTVVANAINDVSTIVKCIDKAREYLDSAEDRYLNFDKNILEDVSKQHAKNIYKALKGINEMKGIEETLENKLAQIVAKHWKHYNENYSRALSQKDIQVYVSGEPEHVQMTELLLEVRFIKRQLESLHEALVAMGWQLKIVTELRVNQLEQVVV